MSKKVYIFLADGFEDIEGLTVVDLMRRAGITITTVSIKNTKQITTAHSITMLTDQTFAETDFTVQTCWISGRIAWHHQPWRICTPHRPSEKLL